MSSDLETRPTAAAPAAPPPGIIFEPARRGRRLPAAWPIFAAFALYPLWVVLGVAVIFFLVLAVPMAVILYRQRPVLVPPYFSIWLLLIIWNIASVVMLKQTAPGTLSPGSPGTGSSPTADAALRIATYVALTILMLYVGNLPRGAVAHRTLARIMAVLFVATVVGGYIGSLDPHLHFNSPLYYLLPHSLLSHNFVAKAVEVSVAQVQSLLPGETAKARASFPFEYTNTWGQNYTLLLPYFLMIWWYHGSNIKKALGAGIVLLSFYPVAASLNRGLWVALVLMVVAMLAWWTLRGRIGVLVVACSALVIALAIVVATPVGALIVTRVETGHSNGGRSNLNAVAIQAAMSSPVIGYGAGRLVIGSGSSIAIGPTTTCKQCGNIATGTDGQFWLLLASQGFPGTFFYIAFFLLLFWRFRADTSPYGLAGKAALLLPLVYMFVYPVIGTPLAICLAGVGIAWRNDRFRREDLVRSTATGTGPLVPAGGAGR